MKTSDKTIRSLYLYETYVKPLEIEADEAQAKFKPKVYEWIADYGNGPEVHTETIIEVEEEKDWIDRCLRPIPISDYAHFKARERDINDSPNVYDITLGPNYLLMQSCAYFFFWYSLPLLILLYIA
tara:strand:+ start:403 stop:780 length:378 start_codon:yes stop_codon:yes gene_type:complete